MIPLEKVPRSGVLIVTIHFANYKSNYANDARRILGGGRGHKGLAEEVKANELNVDLIPLNYWLGRTIVDKVTRSTGGLYKFGFSNMTSQDFKSIVKIIKEKKNKYSWWENVEILVANRVEGYQ